MSLTLKKKATLTLQQTYDSIKGKKDHHISSYHTKNKLFYSELLITTKSQLDDPKLPTTPSLVQDLHKVASLAESFTEQRQKTNKALEEFADTLDREGLLVPCGLLSD